MLLEVPLYRKQQNQVALSANRRTRLNALVPPTKESHFTGVPFRTRVANTFALTTSLMALASSLFADVQTDSQTNSSRLGTAVKPTSQKLFLSLDPASEGYSGSARIELTFHTTTNEFRFHSINLGVHATLDGQDLSVRQDKAGMVSAVLSEPISPGLHSLDLTFTNRFNRRDVGIYKKLIGGKPLLITMLQPNYARSAFPCWDEPQFKIPWQVSVSTPTNYQVFGNCPVESSSVSGTNTTVNFEQTPPMSSFLVALAVGNFDSTPITGTAVPGHVLTIPGKSVGTETAAQESGAVIGELERYLGVPFPYRKLDQVAYPGYQQEGTENTGLVIYDSNFILPDHSRASYEQRQRSCELIAHEISHMWFGNSVTLKWWDDIWLHEGFGTWMGAKIPTLLHPELDFDLRTYRGRCRNAYTMDAEPSVKPIRRSYRGDDISDDVYDWLAYCKGMALLRMAEKWIGEEKLRAVFSSYLQRNSWKNVRSEDFWDMLDDKALVESLRRYVEQPGIPELTFARLPGDRCQITQQRYHALGAKDVEPQLWHVPVEIRYGGPQGTRTARVLLTEKDHTFTFPGLDDASWIAPNAGERGYYLWSLPSDLRAPLLKNILEMTAIERLGVLNSGAFALSSGHLSSEQWVSMLVCMAHDPHAEVCAQAITELAKLRSAYIPCSEQSTFASFLRQTLRPRLDAIGFEPRKGEAPNCEILRKSLLLTLGIEANDPDVAAFCRESAAHQIAASGEARFGFLEAVLPVACWHGDRAWLTQIKTLAERQDYDPDIRSRVISTFAQFRNPALVTEALDYSLTLAFDRMAFSPWASFPCWRSETLNILHSAVTRTELLPIVLDWYAGHFDAVKKKLSEDDLPTLAQMLTEAEPDLLERGRSFFTTAIPNSPATLEQLTNATEAIRVRQLLREKHIEGILRAIGASVK